MKTILLTAILSIFYVHSEANTLQNSINQEIRKTIVNKIGIPELNKDKIDGSTVSVYFKIQENGRIKLSYIKGDNSFLNNYVADKLRNTKVKVSNRIKNRDYSIDVSFFKSESAI